MVTPEENVSREGENVQHREEEPLQSQIPLGSNKKGKYDDELQTSNF